MIEKKRMTPQLLAVARAAYYEATRHKSVVADLDAPLLSIGEAILASIQPAKSTPPAKRRASNGR